jgi:hypothetical protein
VRSPCLVACPPGAASELAEVRLCGCGCREAVQAQHRLHVQAELDTASYPLPQLLNPTKSAVSIR